MLANFRSYQLAVQLHRQITRLSPPAYLKDQLLRASLSVVLNLAEGSAKPTPRDRNRFYSIALGSLRESQAILDLLAEPTLASQADHLAAHLYKLTRATH